jgi:PAS domain S-box-containing protein
MSKLGKSLNINQIPDEDMQDYLENIIAMLPGHIFWKDLNCRFLGCNDLQAKTVGLTSRHEIVGKSAYDVITKNQPDADRRAQAEAIDSVDREIMRTGIGQTLEEPLILEDGSERIYFSQKVPLKNKRGEIIGMLGIAVDITEQRRLETNLLLEKQKSEAESELRRAVTILAGSIAHDLRIPLTSMSIMIDLFTKYWFAFIKENQKNTSLSPTDNDVMRLHLDNIESFPSKMKQTIGEMAEFINVTLKSMQHLVAGTLSYSDFSVCEIEPSINAALAKYPFAEQEEKLIAVNIENNFAFLCYPVLFYRVIFNLMRNSLQQISLNKKGKIYITTSENEKYNILSFKDTAGGASSEIIAHLFDGYKSTKKEGTGVGLAFCKLTLESFDGEMSCNSIEGDYIEFILSFPKLDNSI